jgi:hypothetical protein
MQQSQLLKSYNATVLFQNSKYSIEKYVNQNTGKYSLCVIRDKTFTEWIMVYNPGHVGYDNPFNVANSIKDKVRQFSVNLGTPSIDEIIQARAGEKPTYSEYYTAFLFAYRLLHPDSTPPKNKLIEIFYDDYMTIKIL